MSRLRNYLLASISLMACLWICSCSKSPFSNGVVKEETRIVQGSFCVLEINDDVDVQLTRQLIPSDNTTIKLEVNEKLIDDITTEIHGDTLTIGNNNSLNWIRPYNSTVKATVYYKSIKTISFNSNGSLNSDIIHGYPVYGSDASANKTHLYLEVNGGSGDIDLNIQCDNIHTNYNWGTSAVKLSGDVSIAYTSTRYNCHGPIDSQDLETSFHYIYAYGTNKVIAKAFNQINAVNKNNGIVCYVRYHTVRDEIIWGHYDENNVWIPMQTVPVEYSCPKEIIYQGPGPEATTGLDSIVIQ